MMSGSTGLAWRLESWSQPLFFLGGVLVILYGAILGLEAGTGMAYRTVGALVAGSGGTLAFIGLLGFYRRVVEGSPWLARFAALVTLIGAIGFAALTVVSAGQLAGLLSVEANRNFVFPLVLVGMILGFALFSLGIHRAGEPQLGLLVLAPAIIFAIIAGVGIAELTQMWLSALLGVAHGLTYVGVWIGLRSDSEPTPMFDVQDTSL